MKRCLLTLLAGLALLPVALPAADDNPAADDPDQLIVDLYTKEKLFNKKEYKAVRAAFARRFELKYKSAIENAAKDEAFSKFLDSNPEIKEDFYTAIDEEHDNVDRALLVFADLYHQFPAKVKQFYNLAIATAVVWDQPKHVYDYRGHQVRTKSNLPSGVMDIGPAENFQYYTEAEPLIRKRAELLPWEFLVYVVNNRTPMDERKWSQKEYLGKPSRIGECYKDVPYDKLMLRTKSQECQLQGHDYNLANIRQYGGVCAMQGDFAARVGKSLGIPAEFIGGAGNNLGLHAWVMWVELNKVVKDQVDFRLESYGRYDDMQFYTGDLTDPQTGEKIIDRDMELRLSIVGYERFAKRQAELCMRAYPLIGNKLSLDAKKKMSYLDSCLKVCKYNEAAWLAMAKMSRDGDLKRADIKNVVTHAETLVKTFKNFPDFTWKVLEDLLTAENRPLERIKLYKQAVDLYMNALRPDLVCEACLKLVEYQVEAKRFQDAATGLEACVRKFPNEGRYVPKMMEKLQEVSKQYKGGTDLLARFYLELLPAIKAERAGEVSKYCVDMYQQAIAFFQENKKDNIALELEARLAKIKRGS